MKYSKPFMTKGELIRAGIPRELLEQAYADKKQRFAMKLNPHKKSSNIVYETEEFEKWRLKQIDIQRRMA